MRPCTRTMASKKFITWGFLFILMFLLASEAASRKVLETFELGNSSNSAFILGFYFQFASLYYSHLIKVNRVKKKMKLVKLICFKAIFLVVSDHELCHSISKPIGDEKNTLKSFMAFDITQCGPVFRVVVGS